MPERERRADEQGARTIYDHYLTQADYDALFDKYERDLLPDQGAAVAAIVVWIRSSEAAALTCYEHEPSQCHRHCVAEAVEWAMPMVAARHL